jgi:Protein of unknown function (DUF2971)
MENNIIGIDERDWDCPICRIYPMRWFQQLIMTRENTLVKLESWDDPFENFLLKNPVITIDGELGSLKSLHDAWYGQCWTKNVSSDMMWRIYSPAKSGIQVTTTIKKLFSSFYNASDDNPELKYFIGLVEYKSRTEIEDFIGKINFTDFMMGGQMNDLVKTICIKRQEFSHEQEIRLLFQDSNGTRNRVKFPFNPNLTLDKITLDPRLSSDEFEVDRNVLVKLGCEVEIVKSDLYQFTPPGIQL